MLDEITINAKTWHKLINEGFEIGRKTIYKDNNKLEYHKNIRVGIKIEFGVYTSYAVCGKKNIEKKVKHNYFEHAVTRARSLVRKYENL